MSDYVPSIPYAPGTPEYDQYLRAQGIFPMAVGSGALTQVLPLREGEGGQIQPALPGIVTGGYGMLGAGLPQILGSDFRLPGAEAAQRSWEDTAKVAQHILPSRAAAEATGDPTIQQAESIGEGIGAATVPMPGAAASGLAAVTGALPRAIGIPLRVATNLVTAPEAAHLPTAMLASAGLGTGLTALANNAQAAPTETFDPTQIPDDRLQTQAPQGGAQTLPFDTTSPTTNQLPVPPIPPTQVPPAQDTGTSGLAPAPTYGQEGESPFWNYMRGAAAIAGTAAAGWVALKYGGHVLQFVADSAPGSVSRNVAVANQAVQARDAGIAAMRTSLKPGPDIEVPLPAPAGQTAADAPGTRFVNNYIRKTEVANKLVDATTPNQTTADALKNTIGTAMSQQEFKAAFENHAYTGRNILTGQLGPSLYDLANTVDQMTPAQREQWSAGMWAGSELKPRAGGDPTNFLQTSDAELNNAYRTMMQDPLQVQARNQVQAINASRWDALATSGRITQAEAAANKLMHPEWLPNMDADGNVVPKGSASSMLTQPTDALTAVIRGEESAYKEAQFGSMQRNVIDNVVNWQNADPNRPIIFSKYEVPKDTPDPVTGQMVRTMVPGDEAIGRTIRIYRNGVPETWITNNTVAHTALTQSPKQMGGTIDTLNRVRSFLQSNITGPMAALTQQRLFGLTQMARTAVTLPMSADRGTYAGPIDKFTQSVFGFHYRLPDPTMYGYIGYTAGRDAASAIAKNLGDMLAVKSNPVSQAMRAAVGDTWTDAFSNRLTQYHAGSQLARNLEMGVGRAGGAGMVDTPAFLGSKNVEFMNPLANQFPDLFYNTPGKARLPGQSGLLTSYINWRTLVRELHTAVSDSGNAAYYKLNENNPRFSNETMARLSRGLIGDTSMTGASGAIQAASKLIPYFNPIVQDTARMIKNYKDAPFTTVAGVTGTLMTLAAAQTLSAMMGGKDAVNHMENQVTTQQRGSDVTIYHDPDNYLNHTIISLPQRLRWLYPLFLEGVSTAVGAFQAHAGEPTGDRVINALSDLFSHHIQTSTFTSMRHGAYSMFDVSPGADVTAAAALGGKTIGEFPGTLIENAIHGLPLTSNLFRSVDDPEKVPGQLPGGSYLSHNDGAWMSNLLSNLGGGLATAYHTFIGTPWERIHEGATPWAAMIGAGSDVLQNFRDNNPMGNIVWGNTAKLNKYDPLAEVVSNKMAAIKLLGSTKDLSSIGFVDGYPTSVRNADKVPQDPTMRNMWLQTVNFQDQVKELEAQRSALSVNMQQVQSGGDSAQDKRTLMNGFTGQYADVTAQLDARLRWLESRLSDMSGGRVVDLGKPINWQGTVDQFPR